VDLITMRANATRTTTRCCVCTFASTAIHSPPTDDEIVREVGGYARTRLPQVKDAAATVASTTPHSPAPAAVGAANDAGGDTERESGIIEID
jgi:hypothetical protein